MHRYPGLVSRLDGAAQEKKQRVGVILEKAAALARARMGSDGEVLKPPSPLLGDPSRLVQPKAPAFLTASPAAASPPAAGASAPGAGPALPAGPIGPAAKTKKDKKERKKEKKKEKKERKKEKGKSGKKKRKKSSSDSDFSSSSAPPEDSPEDLEEQAPSTTRYKGHFLHPAFGSRSIHTTVQLQTAAVGSWGEATGHWVIMGEVVDSKVTATYEGKRVIFSDGTIVLEGTVQDKGSVRGEVVMGGVRGGSFELTPAEPTAEAVDLASPSGDSQDSPQFAEPVGGAASSDESDDLVVLEEVSRPMAPPPARPGGTPLQKAVPAKAAPNPAKAAPPAGPPPLSQDGEPRLRPGSGRPMCIKSGATVTRSKAKSKAGTRDLEAAKSSRKEEVKSGASKATSNAKEVAKAQPAKDVAKSPPAVKEGKVASTKTSPAASEGKEKSAKLDGSKPTLVARSTEAKPSKQDGSKATSVPRPADKPAEKSAEKSSKSARQEEKKRKDAKPDSEKATLRARKQAKVDKRSPSSG